VKSAVPGHIALNALFLHYPLSGTGRYLSNLIERAACQVDLGLLGAVAYPPAAPSSTYLLRLVRTPFDRRQRNLAKVWFEQVALQLAARKTGAALLHNPYFAAPLASLLPTVVTVHDLVPLLRPEYRGTAMQRLYTALVTGGLRAASRIITDSEASARDLRGRLGVPGDRLRVVPLGVAARFRPLETDDERTFAAAVLARHGLDRPYFLYVGGLDRRKNVGGLVRAFARLKRERDVPHVLAIVATVRSGDALFYDPRPDVERLGIGDAVCLPGPLPDDEVRALHARADAFVFPSFYEGFGLPPLEAMACGAPVVCSNASSLPEVVGDSGLLFDPSDDAGLVALLWRVSRDQELRRDLGRRGRERAARFTWENTVRSTIEVWDEVLGRRR